MDQQTAQEVLKQHRPTGWPWRRRCRACDKPWRCPTAIEADAIANPEIPLPLEWFRHPPKPEPPTEPERGQQRDA